MKLIAEPEIGTQESQETGGLRRLRSLFPIVAHAHLAQVAGMVGVCSVLALLFLRKFYLSDPDIWWHLATGRRILQHHAVPMTDPFSSYGLGKPWIAYSWLFDITMQLSIARSAMSRLSILKYWFAWRWRWRYFIWCGHCFRAFGGRRQLPASPCMR